MNLIERHFRVIVALQRRFLWTTGYLYRSAEESLHLDLAKVMLVTSLYSFVGSEGVRCRCLRFLQSE
jgi:hypothetical protein